MRNVQSKALAGLMSLIAAGSCTQAAMIPLLAGSPTHNGANYDWTYNVTIGSDFRVKTGDFFTIYDFGAVLGHSQPAGWAFSTTLVGVNPILVAPADAPLLLNVTFTYLGTTPIDGAANLGNFVLTLNNNIITNDVPYGSQVTRNGGTQDGQFASDYGTLTGPGSPSEAPPFPEPTALGILTCAAPSLLRRRRQS